MNLKDDYLLQSMQKKLKQVSLPNIGIENKIPTPH